MVKLLCVGMGGFIGSVCRYLVGLLPMKLESGFPIKTCLINIAGAFILGMIGALAVKNKSWSPELVLMLKVGVCGGFTTFSTFAFETADLMQKGSMGTAVLYAAVSMVLGVAAVFGAELLVK